MLSTNSQLAIRSLPMLAQYIRYSLVNPVQVPVHVRGVDNIKADDTHLCVYSYYWFCEQHHLLQFIFVVRNQREQGDLYT